MKNLETKTVNEKSNVSTYKQNLKSVTTFLRHGEDRITVINGKSVNLEIYHNGKLLFIGDKYELFD
ncbi:hypothetical protein RXV22_28475, partial [Pseudomonas aeruginosa]|nr:hypothetical protein [Pseudomonas aeruginosa]